jgi:DNA-binding response OmpR family regulator
MSGSVLLVEDEENLASLVRAYLEQEGYRVIPVTSGGEALRAFDAEPVRIVVLDLNLPDMDGLDVCRQIRTRSSVPVVMLTARDEEPDRLAGLETGADDYIGKPFSPRELVARMKAVLRRTGTFRRRMCSNSATSSCDAVRARSVWRASRSSCAPRNSTSSRT